MTARYADKTKVSVDSSRGEITGILAKHGVQRMGWMGAPDGDQLMFEIEGASYRLNITRPTAESLRERDSGQYTYPDNVDWASKVEQEWRRRWRANVLLLKAKLEFIEAGDTTLDRELMPYRVLPTGETIEEALMAGGLKALGPGR